MADARVYPPSEQRLAEARGVGHVPRPRLVGLAGALLALALWARSGLPVLTEGVTDLLREPLAQLAQGRLPPARSVVEAAAALLGSTLLLALACIFALMVAAQWLGQGFAWGRAAKRRGRLAFEAPKPDPTARVLFALAVSAWSAGMLFDGLRVARGSLASVIGTWLHGVVLLLLACALIDAAFARARYFQSLWLTRREVRDQTREAYGAPEVRAERERRRRAGRGLGGS